MLHSTDLDLWIVLFDMVQMFALVSSDRLRRETTVFWEIIQIIWLMKGKFENSQE